MYVGLSEGRGNLLHRGKRGKAHALGLVVGLRPPHKMWYNDGDKPWRLPMGWQQDNNKGYRPNNRECHSLSRQGWHFHFSNQKGKPPSGKLRGQVWR